MMSTKTVENPRIVSRMNGLRLARNYWLKRSNSRARAMLLVLSAASFLG
jgi:hypothetical protein